MVWRLGRLHQEVAEVRMPEGQISPEEQEERTREGTEADSLQRTFAPRPRSRTASASICGRSRVDSNRACESWPSSASRGSWATATAGLLTWSPRWRWD